MSITLRTDSKVEDPAIVLHRKPERIPLLTRKSSQTLPTLSSLASPTSETLRKQGDSDNLDPSGLQHGVSSPVFGVPAGAGAAGPREMSRAGSISPPSVFDDNPDDGRYTEPTTGLESGSPDETSYDLKPPPPSVSHTNVEALALRFFSVDHLNIILRDSVLAGRFAKFLEQYRPQHAKTLAKYFDTKKAATAIEYANAVAESIPTAPGFPPYVAATLDDRFEAHMRELVDDLVEDALPAYVTHRLTQVVTESLVKEVTGTNAPIMQEMIPSLAEVYCVTDPSLPDNPIVYASQGINFALNDASVY